MSNLDDINKGRLIYTCNCGWIDLDHVEDDSKREFVGLKNLWKQIREGDFALGAQPDGAYIDARVFGFPYEDPLHRQYEPPGPRGFPYVNPFDHARFPDGTPGFKVTYRQDMGKWCFIAGTQRSYLVRYGLTWQEQREVALAIFMEVSELFEGFQGSFPYNIVTNSGFSQEDLVSNLLGVYIAIGDYTLPQGRSICKEVSKGTAEAIWDREGSVEEHKHRTFKPAFAKETGGECVGSERIFAKEFRRIRPAIKGGEFTDFPGPGSGAYLRDEGF